LKDTELYHSCIAFESQLGDRDAMRGAGCCPLAHAACVCELARAHYSAAANSGDAG